MGLLRNALGVVLALFVCSCASGEGDELPPPAPDGGGTATGTGAQDTEATTQLDGGVLNDAGDFLPTVTERAGD